MYRIRPGDDIDWVAAGEVIRVIPPGKQAASRSRESQPVCSIKPPNAIASGHPRVPRGSLATGDGTLQPKSTGTAS
jgi:hypothetical protein